MWSRGERGQVHAADLVKGAPVHGPQLNGGGSHNGGRPGRLEQQGGVSKHPPSLHVDLDLAALHLYTHMQPHVVEHLPCPVGCNRGAAAGGWNRGCTRGCINAKITVTRPAAEAAMRAAH